MVIEKKHNKYKSEYFEVSGGEIKIWIEQDSSIQIKTENEFNDPVELNAAEVKELGQLLIDLAKKIQ